MEINFFHKSKGISIGVSFPSLSPLPNQKGISTIIAVVLLLLITIGIVWSTYTFLTSATGSVTKAGRKQIEQQRFLDGIKFMLEEKAQYVQWHNNERKESFAIFAKSFSKRIKEFEGKRVYCFDLRDLEKILRKN